MSDVGDVHVEFAGITKRFGATVAVDRADLAIERGSIHGLVGENGAGKSTLGRILAGVATPDEGELRVAGRAVSFRSPRDSLDHGITSIAQELSLVPARSVVDNVFLGIEEHSGPLVLRRASRRRFDELAERTGIWVDSETRVDELSVADQQKVEILRALARESEFIIMDEPTARLSAEQTSNLLRMVRLLAEGGTTVLYISHFLEEVLETVDMVTIMRDGHIVRTRQVSEETHESLIEGMIGRSLEATFPPKLRPPDDAREVLRVAGLTRNGVFEDVSFSVREGEIVAMAGLVGSGRSEVARSIFGADPHDAGRVEIMGADISARSPRDVMSAGVAFIPESRKEQGLVLGRPVRENVSLPHLDRFTRTGVVARRAERRATKKAVQEVDIRGGSIEAPVMVLSGGNQQKALFARGLLGKPSVLIADEPTRGVDVGAKRTIYDLIVDLAAEGMAVLVISSELEEVLGLAHRILVMRKGRIVAEIDGDEATEEDVMTVAFGAGR